MNAGVRARTWFPTTSWSRFSTVLATKSAGRAHRCVRRRWAASTSRSHCTTGRSPLTWCRRVASRRPKDDLSFRMLPQQCGAPPGTSPYRPVAPRSWTRVGQTLHSRWLADHRRSVPDPRGDVTRSPGPAVLPSWDLAPRDQETHDYKRNGTTTLFSALEVATGRPGHPGLRRPAPARGVPPVPQAGG
jgi:hypothetical protein